MATIQHSGVECKITATRCFVIYRLGARDLCGIKEFASLSEAQDWADKQEKDAQNYFKFIEGAEGLLFNTG